MRILVVLLVVLTGCASGGQVRATSDVGGVRFTFDRQGKPIEVGGIDVYEYDGGKRGRTVCELKRVSASSDGVLGLRSWAYGQNVDTKYVARACSQLVRGREYGVNVFHLNCVAYTGFKLSAGGEVIDLGPNQSSCYM